MMQSQALYCELGFSLILLMWVVYMYEHIHKQVYVYMYMYTTCMYVYTLHFEFGRVHVFKGSVSSLHPLTPFSSLLIHVYLPYSST